MNPTLTFACESVPEGAPRRTETLHVAPSRFVIAGWTGRDEDAIRHHIHELQAIGVTPPSSVPLYYRAGAALLTQADTIEALGDRSSGEAEPVLFVAGGRWWLTVGSDHTDREVEGYSVAVSKQMCPKPVAAAAWAWDDVAARQDELELRSRILEGDRWVDYQRGTLAAIRPLVTLRDAAFAGDPAGEGAFVSCGTLGALPDAQGVGIRPASRMEIELHDPRLGRSIVHRYRVQALPVVA